MQRRELRVLEAQAFLQLEHDVLQHAHLFLEASEDGEILERGLGRQAGEGGDGALRRARLRGAHERDRQIGDHARSLPVPHRGALAPFGTDEALGAERGVLAEIVGLVGPST